MIFFVSKPIRMFLAGMTSLIVAYSPQVFSSDMRVDKSNGQLTISSDIDGTVIAKVVGPDDVVVVDERYYGNSFSWAPSSGPDGAYRYDVRVIAASTANDQTNKDEATNNDYAGGSVEVVNGQLINTGEE